VFALKPIAILLKSAAILAYQPAGKEVTFLSIDTVVLSQRRATSSHECLRGVQPRRVMAGALAP